MVKKYVRVPDFRDSRGRWVRTLGKDGVQYQTRAHEVWSRMESRCRAPSVRAARPTCEGNLNMFTDFQEFAEWAQTQHGYTSTDEAGRYWCLDKDLKVFNNKIYSPSTCLFIPNRINILITSRANKGLPLGVTLHKQVNGFVGQITTGRYAVCKRHLGVFKSVEEAHKAWQYYKIKQLELASEDLDLTEEIRELLLDRARRIKEDYNNDRITERV